MADRLVHLNAHETGPVPCLCRNCIDTAPEQVTLSSSSPASNAITLIRKRAEAKGAFLWYWQPQGIDAERVRRAVEARLASRKQKVVTPRVRVEKMDDVFPRQERGEDEDA